MIKQKQVSLLESQVKSANKDLELATLKMAHVVMKRKRPYTELESVVLLCLEIAADILHGGKKAVTKVREISLSDNTTKRRCDDISKDLLKQIIKLKTSPAYGLQLDETTDISDEQQLIVYCRFLDAKVKNIVEHCLCCVKDGVSATAQSIFDKLHEFIVEHDLDWTKCKSVTTDGAAAMRGRKNGVVQKIKKVSPDCISDHCMMIHREDLVVKKLNHDKNQRSELEIVLSDIIKAVNFVRSHSKKHRMFSELCKNMEANQLRLLYYAEVRCLSRGKVLNRVFQLRNELSAFLTLERHPMSANFEGIYRLAKLSYLSAVFESTNQLNLSIQGKRCNIFEISSKIQAFKSKLKLWQSNVKKCNFSDFESLNKFIKISDWENNNPNIEATVKLLVHQHLNLLQQNFEAYFSDDDYLKLNSLLWIVQPFTNEEFDLGHLNNELIELRSDLVQKAEFKSVINYNEFWGSLFEVPEYQNLAQKAISVLIGMPTTYLCEQGFSAPVEIKSNKRNAIKEVDMLMRGALETRLLPRFSQLADEIPQQRSH